jgi:beta-glucosidase
MTFEFGVGIECTFIVHETPHMRRLEEFELMRHYDNWKSDLDLVAKLNADGRRVTKLRWCFPWYRMEPERGKIDFDWADRVVDYANELNIDLVPDIMHYGTPTWLMESAYMHADFPDRLATFGAACAERYKGRVKYYTPVNEPGITCMFSAERGEWPPYYKSEDGYVKVMMQVAEAVRKTTKGIKSMDPGAECWGVEALNADAAPEARRRLLRDLVCWDLVHGKVNEKHETWAWLTKHGATEKQLQRFLDEPVSLEVLGVNFYPWQSKTVEMKDGKLVEEFDLTGKLLLDLLRDCHQHTGAQRLWITETSAHGGGGAKSSAMKPVKEPDRRAAWMDGTLEATAEARRAGLPVEGYIQFPLYSMVDWAFRHDLEAAPEEYYINLGMIEVDPKTYERKWTPVADRFLHHLKTFEK